MAALTESDATAGPDAVAAFPDSLRGNMAQFNSMLFNKKATDKLSSPDALDRYVRVARPGVWVILAACALLLGGLIVWGIFGTVYVNVNATGVRMDDKVLCFLSEENTSHIKAGNDATVESAHLSVASISDNPLSINEVKEIVESDYLVSTLVGGEEWVYEVDLEGDEIDELKEGVSLSVSITTDHVSPLDLVFGTGE